MDSDDLEFLMAVGQDMSDAEYAALMNELQSEEFLEDTTPEVLLAEVSPRDEFYALAGDWDDWLEPDEWYELTAEYTENN